MTRSIFSSKKMDSAQRLFGPCYARFGAILNTLQAQNIHNMGGQSVSGHYQDVFGHHQDVFGHGTLPKWRTWGLSCSLFLGPLFCEWPNPGALSPRTYLKFEWYHENAWGWCKVIIGAIQTSNCRQPDNIWHEQNPIQNFRAKCTTNFLSSFQNPWKDSQLPNKGIIISHLKMETSTFENTKAMAASSSCNYMGSSAFPLCCIFCSGMSAPQRRLTRVFLKVIPSPDPFFLWPSHFVIFTNCY